MSSRNTIDDSSYAMIDEMDRDVVDETKRFGKRGYFGKETFTGNLSGGEDSISDSHLCEEGHSHEHSDHKNNVSSARVDEVSVFSKKSEQAAAAQNNANVKELTPAQRASNRKVALAMLTIAVVLIIPGVIPISAFLIFVSMLLLLPPDSKNILRTSVVLTFIITAALVVAKRLLLE